MRRIATLLAFVALSLLVGCELEGEERRSLRIRAEGKGIILVQTGSPHYDEVLTFLEDSEIEGDGYGGYELSAKEYVEVDAMLPTPSPEEVQEVEMWREQEKHWDNLVAITMIMDGINEDNVVDLGETQYVCSLVNQWEEKMQAAADYIKEYRRIDNALVDETPSLANLEIKAKEKLSLIGDLVASCEVVDSPMPITPTLNSTPTPAVDFTNMTEEEIEAELQKDPCYMGKGQFGYRWDVECQMRRKRLRNIKVAP